MKRARFFLRGDNEANRRTRRTALRLASLSEAIRGNRLDEAFVGAVGRALAPAVDADMAKLDEKDVELIYGNWSDAFERRVAGEFEADPGSIVDHGPGAEEVCKLCHHHPIRFEFLLKNRINESSVWTGSVCIVDYGVNVLGAKTEGEARKILLGAVRGAVMAWRRKEWLAAHPGASEEIEDGCAFFEDATARLPYDAPAPLVERVRRGRRAYGVFARQMERRGFLTNLRTGMWQAQLALRPGVRAEVEAVVAEARRRLRSPRGSFFTDLQARYPTKPWERRVLEDLVARNGDLTGANALSSREAVIVRRIQKRPARDAG